MEGDFALFVGACKIKRSREPDGRFGVDEIAGGVFGGCAESYFFADVGGEIRQRMRVDLQANRDWMAPIATRYPVRGRPLPLTRMADILIFMDARHPEQPHPVPATRTT